MESITGHPASSFDASFCNDFNDMLESTGFDQHMDAMQMLMANLCHESCGFRYMKEIDPGYYLDGRKDLGNIYPGDGPVTGAAGPCKSPGVTTTRPAPTGFVITVALTTARSWNSALTTQLITTHSPSPSHGC